MSCSLEEKIRVMQAYENGSVIQCILNEVTGVWKDTPEEPTWAWGVYNYRIKPEPESKLKFRPLTWEEFLKWRDSWFKYGSDLTYSRIESMDPSSKQVYIHNSWYTLEEILERFVRVDKDEKTHTCGVLE